MTFGNPLKMMKITDNSNGELPFALFEFRKTLQILRICWFRLQFRKQISLHISRVSLHTPVKIIVSIEGNIFRAEPNMDSAVQFHWPGDRNPLMSLHVQ